MSETKSARTELNRMELEANQFAYALLMPEKFLMEDWDRVQQRRTSYTSDDDIIRWLANRYKVSQTMMTVRMVNLGLITPL